MQINDIASLLKERMVFAFMTFYEGIVRLLHPDARLKILTTKWLYYRRLKSKLTQLESELDEVLENEGENSFQARPINTQIGQLNFQEKYSVTPNSGIGKRIRYLQDAGFSDTEINYLLLNKLIDEDGAITVSTAREYFSRILGWIFVIACCCAIVIHLLVIWSANAPVFLQIILSIFVSAFFGTSALLMNCYSLLPKQLPLKALHSQIYQNS